MTRKKEAKLAQPVNADKWERQRNAERITLVKRSWQAPQELPFGQETIVPLRAGETLRWQLEQ